MSDEPRGRGAGWNPPNRFEPYRIEVSADDVDAADDGPRRLETELLVDTSRSILAENDSPDVPFRYSLNPYRGCEHGCVYCYARPSHEYLGFSAGLDFESRILVKPDAPNLLDGALRRPGWVPQTVALSGNTDCYQPVERRLELSRRCLEVFARHRNPVAVITKNALVTRDLDLLGELATLDLAAVTVSITTLDSDLARTMEPRASTPARRLEAVEQLASAGVPVGVNIAPVVPDSTTRRSRPSSRKPRAVVRARQPTSCSGCRGRSSRSSSSGSIESSRTAPGGCCIGSARSARDGSATRGSAAACGARERWPRACARCSRRRAAATA
jgi:DNA repair photolyase